MFNEYLQKTGFFERNFQKISRALQFLNNFNICTTALRNENNFSLQKGGGADL